jgi:transducin (beta)-like 1
MSISSDEINYLIYRYLQENGTSISHLLKDCMNFFYFLSYRAGFTHTAFSFAYESLVTKSSVSQIEIPPGALITFLQKGLEYVGIEEHINEVNDCI